MKKITFYKLQASGNDFILINALKGKPFPTAYPVFARKYCCRKVGIGADGVLVIEPAKKALFKMRIINADGSEAEMCGNGARCAAFWARTIAGIAGKNSFSFETMAGRLEAEVKNRALVKVRIPDPSGLKTRIPIELFRRRIKVNFINTSVPHVVVFVQGISDINVDEIGRALRRHKTFSPAGANVNFVQVEKPDLIRVRTYERGVEGETLACGTGSTASAIVSSYIADKSFGRKNIKVETKGGEILKIYFNKEEKNTVSDVWLEGRAVLVYTGACQV